MQRLWEIDSLLSQEPQRGVQMDPLGNEGFNDASGPQASLRRTGQDRSGPTISAAVLHCETMGLIDTLYFFPARGSVYCPPPQSGTLWRLYHVRATQSHSARSPQSARLATRSTYAAATPSAILLSFSKLIRSAMARAALHRDCDGAHQVRANRRPAPSTCSAARPSDVSLR